MMKSLIKISLVFLWVFAGLFTSGKAQAQTPTPGHKMVIILFWGDGCPHCAKAKPYLEGLPSRYPGVVLQEYEVYYNEINQEYFLAMLEAHQIEQAAVPTIFVGPYYLQGYSEEVNADIEKVILQCLKDGCANPSEGVDFPAGGPTLTPTPAHTPVSTPTPQAEAVYSSGASPASSTPAATPAATPAEVPESLAQQFSLKIPLLGRFNLEPQPIFLSTALIALMDGFNPCSLWVLSILLALALHTGSRKKILVIGLIFLTVTSFIYALFIAGLFSFLQLSRFLEWMQMVVILISLFFALINIKDYFWYKKGLSMTIADDKKPWIYKRMRAVTQASQSFWGLAGATVLLAASVSMVEFSCTAGFPIVWVNLLNAQKVSATAFGLLLIMYMLIYQLDELVIFLAAVITLRSNRMEEKHGRLLKLAGGMLMLALAVAMLIDPALMNNLGSSIMVFGFAIAATLLVLFIHQVLLPKLTKSATKIDAERS